MTNFTTRVELHDADSDDYITLHDEMKKEGFIRTITSDDGTTYKLPPAEYNYTGRISCEKVRDKAASAASQVKNSYEVLVTESAGRCWQGLKVAR
jgi:hypothetical protein